MVQNLGGGIKLDANLWLNLRVFPLIVHCLGWFFKKIPNPGNGEGKTGSNLMEVWSFGLCVFCVFFGGAKTQKKSEASKRWLPGDSKWPFYPLVGGHDSPLKGSRVHHRKKVTFAELPGRWWQLKCCFIFTPKPWGFMIQFDGCICFNWVETRVTTNQKTWSKKLLDFLGTFCWSPSFCLAKTRRLTHVFVKGVSPVFVDVFCWSL